MDALTTALTSPPNKTNASASRKREIELSKFATRRSRKVPVKAAMVAPAAWPSAVKAGSGLRKATKNAADATAGNISYPHISMAANAIP
jgi:hypothetical protein